MMSTNYVKPPKVLKTFVSNIIADEIFDGGPDDLYSGYPYRWIFDISIDAQEHGNRTTPSPYFYDADSIEVGDWICASLNGIAVQIVEIVEHTGNTLKVKVEDIERYNMLTEPVSFSSFGSGPTGAGLLFTLADDGLPVLAPVPDSYLPAPFATDLISRFRHRNNFRNFVRVRQPGHDMVLGDIIRPDFNNPGNFVKALGDVNVSSVIGVVTDVNTPSADWFNFKPFGEIREKLSPALEGNYGDYFYVHPTIPGQLTKIRPSNNARPIYMRLDSPTRGLLLSMGGAAPDSNETKRFDVLTPAGDQTNFTLPADAEEVLWMSINGVENDNYTFDSVSKVLVFDPVATGYGVDVTDEVFFIYKS